MGNGGWIIMRPCKAFGPADAYKLRHNIAAGMRYWFNRIILELPSVESHSESRSVRRRYNATYRRRRRWRLRQQGFTYYEVEAKIRGTTPEYERERHRAIGRAYRTKWGGHPSYVGSEAWKRRTLAAHGVEA